MLPDAMPFAGFCQEEGERAKARSVGQYETGMQVQSNTVSDWGTRNPSQERIYIYSIYSL